MSKENVTQSQDPGREEGRALLSAWYPYLTILYCTPTIFSFAPLKFLNRVDFKYPNTHTYTFWETLVCRLKFSFLIWLRYFSGVSSYGFLAIPSYLFWGGGRDSIRV
jgi:hypothetical protein